MGGCCVGNCCIMDNAVGDFFRDLFGRDKGCSYTPGPSLNVDHAKKIAGELEDMKTNLRTASENIEKDIAIDIVQSMSEFINQLERINEQSFGEVVLNLDIKALRDKNNELKRSVKGTVANYIDEQLIMTNNELSSILAEMDDKKREKSFKKFCNKVQNKAIDKLKNKITIIVQEQEEILKRELNARISEVENSAAETIELLKELTKMKNKDDSEIEKTMFEQMFIFELCSIILNDVVKE